MYKVYYIQHSCFIIELDDKYLLFDYFNKATCADMVSYSGCLPEFEINKKLYVFASHSHKDHWGVEVLQLGQARDNVKFILSKDIRLGSNYLKKNGFDVKIKEKIKFVSHSNHYEIDDLSIDTLRSNDAGVAYFVSCNGKNFFHAGDLNWWNIEGRGELYGEQYGREFKRALRHIENKKIDVAFVVLDPRLNENGYYLGMDYFIKKIEAINIFPMHMWGQYEWILRFKERPDIANLKERVVEITQENMIFEIEE